MRHVLSIAAVLFVSVLPFCVKAQSEGPPPLPDRNPLRVKPPTVAKPLLPGEMPSVPWTEAEVSLAKSQCAQSLASLKIDYEQLAPIKEGVCGAPAPILVKSIGADPKVVIDPPATITCPLAKALSVWLDEVVQPEAKKLLGSNVVKLRNATSYACRNRYGAAEGLLSEHALANALDVSEFVFADGSSVTVLQAWPRVAATPPLPLPNPSRAQTVAAKPAAASKPPAPNTIEVTKAKADAAPLPSPPPAAKPPASDPKTDFVRFVHDEACKEAFGTVLGPEANDAHKNHFHFDMKARRHSAYCQ